MILGTEAKTKKNTKIKMKEKDVGNQSQQGKWPPAIEFCQDAWARLPVVVVIFLFDNNIVDDNLMSNMAASNGFLPPPPHS